MPLFGVTPLNLIKFVGIIKLESLGYCAVLLA